MRLFVTCVTNLTLIPDLRHLAPLILAIFDVNCGIRLATVGSEQKSFLINERLFSIRN